jgi:hypothetical protein
MPWPDENFRAYEEAGEPDIMHEIVLGMQSFS